MSTGYTKSRYQALPLVQLFKFACKEGESLVYFDHVLDVVVRGYCLAADFAHTHASIAGPKPYVHRRNQLLNGNHI